MIADGDLEAILAVLVQVMDERIGPIEARLALIEGNSVSTDAITVEPVDRWADMRKAAWEAVAEHVGIVDDAGDHQHD